MIFILRFSSADDAAATSYKQACHSVSSLLGTTHPGLGHTARAHPMGPSVSPQQLSLYLQNELTAERHDSEHVSRRTQARVCATTPNVVCGCEQPQSLGLVP